LNGISLDHHSFKFRDPHLIRYGLNTSGTVGNSLKIR
jgi:hypothetical protein